MPNRLRPADELRILERRKKIMANLLGGLGVNEIARAMDIQPSFVSKEVRDMLKEYRETHLGEVTEWVALESKRLDRLLNAIWNNALEGHLPTIDRVLKIAERRAKLLGLDAADQKTSIEITNANAPFQINIIRREEPNQLPNARVLEENPALEGFKPKVHRQRLLGTTPQPIMHDYDPDSPDRAILGDVEVAYLPEAEQGPTRMFEAETEYDEGLDAQPADEEEDTDADS